MENQVIKVKIINSHELADCFQANSLNQIVEVKERSKYDYVIVTEGYYLQYISKHNCSVLTDENI